MWYCSLHNFYPSKKDLGKCIKEEGKYKSTRRFKRCKHLVKLERRLYDEDIKRTR